MLWLAQYTIDFLVLARDGTGRPPEVPSNQYFLWLCTAAPSNHTTGAKVSGCLDEPKFCSYQHFPIFICYIHLTDFHSSCATTTCMLQLSSALQLFLPAKEEVYTNRQDHKLCNFILCRSLYTNEPITCPAYNSSTWDINEQILVQLCCTELLDLKAKSSENRILHLPVNCTLNSSCSNLHFSLSFFFYFFSPSTFAWVSTLAKD